MNRKVKKQRRRYWTIDEIELLAREFCTTPTKALAKKLGRTAETVACKAYTLGLRKSPEYLSSPASGRLQGERGTATRFKPGQTPWNKGKRYVAGGRSHLTQFRPRRPEESPNYAPIGTLRVNGASGHLERKVSDDRSIATSRRWMPVHRLVWEATHGPVPDGHVVAFRAGRFSTVEEEITLDALELITRAELMNRNTRHNLPPELNQLIQLRGALNRKIRNRTKDHDSEPNAERA